MHTLKSFVALAIVATIAATPAIAAKLRQPTGEHEIPTLSQDMLVDAAMIEMGKEIWQDQCAHCHGARAYPGKAPKLKPRIYSPEFVYERVTFGFRKMPAWEDVYEDEELKAIVAWVLSKNFRP